MKAKKEECEKLDRLQKRSDFLRLSTGADKWVAKGFTFLALPNGLEKSRFGITVTKRLEKSAVKRNRMKRRLRSLACDVLATRAMSGTDYILIAKEGAMTRPYIQMEKDLLWCLEKTGYGIDA